MKLCFMGLHHFRYIYGEEIFLTWKEIESGMEKPPLAHLGWLCDDCGRWGQSFYNFKHPWSIPPYASRWERLRGMLINIYRGYLP